MRFGRRIFCRHRELVSIIDTVEEEGVIDEWQGEMLQSTLEFRDTTIEKIMTPRIDVTAIDIDDFFEEIEFIKPEGFACEYSTMDGWAIEMLDADPHVGDSFRFENLFIIVAQMDEERVTKLTVLVEEKPDEEEKID